MILLAQGKKQAEIAKALGRSSSTISRELKRHALESYSATNAQNSYLPETTKPAQWRVLVKFMRLVRLAIQLCEAYRD